ncbi:hypothetical protein LdCL_250006600 [Leishmania donovani]|uniref:Uncharacterized protein n=1 Tax=Leishmania donovani TaxID=5661 RepID=A0A3Q8ID38_LEIDO|nr:hypothetical protein LdCL_250006600 [Leishmania donovani]
MDSTDAATTTAWAFAAAPAEGVPALELLVNEYAWLSALPFDDLLTHSGSHQGRLTGARELMSSLLSVSMPCPSPAQVSLYVVLASRVYVALFLDTVERKRRLLRSEKLDTFACVDEGCFLARVHATMQAWTRDLVPILVRSVLPCLHLRDAEPTTVRASNPLDRSPSASGLASDDDTESKPSEQRRDLLEALHVYRVREELVRLVVALRRTTGDEDDSAAALLLAAYATLCSTEVCPSVALPRPPLRGSTTATLQQWRARVLQEMSPTTPRNVAAGRGAASETEVDGDLGTSFTRCLARLRGVAGEVHCYPSGDSLSFALAALQASGLSGGHGGKLHLADVERGTEPPDSTAASLAAEHDREVEACTLVALDAVDAHSGEASAGSPEEYFSLPLCRQGALLLLADVLRHQLTAAEHPSFAYSVSASSLLLGVADAYIVALRCARSAAVLLRHLLFLHDLLSAVPKHTLCSAEEAQHRELRDCGQRVLDSCHTRRYESFFDIARELLTISALCPVDEHRRMARTVALELLERLEERTRVRMHGSLMALCPYPSIARFFLEELLHEWRAAKSESDHLAERQASPVHSLMPLAIRECVQAFLTQVSMGTSGFVDPLVVALNFVRVEVCQQAWIRSLCTPAAMSAAGDRDASVRCAWCQLLRALREQLLPRCHTLMANAATVSEEHPTKSFAVEVSLTPLDVFSLSCAVEGLEEVLA